MNSGKRSRKSKHVPRELFDSDEELLEMQNALDRTISGYRNINQSAGVAPKPARVSTKLPAGKAPPANTASALELSVKVEVENVNHDDIETIPEPKAARMDVSFEELFQESNKVLEGSDNVCDRVLHFQMLMSCRSKRKKTIKSSQDTLLDKALLRWRDWAYETGATKEPPLFYKCYVCEMAWWHLYEFREHIRIHKFNSLRVNVEINDCIDCNIVAYVDTLEKKLIDVKGQCWRCGENGVEHLNVKHCRGCQKEFKMCLKLREHELFCDEYKKTNTEMSQATKLRCHLCCFYYFKAVDLFDHMVLRHSVRSDVPVPGFLVECTKCCDLVPDFHNHKCDKRPYVRSCMACKKRFVDANMATLHRTCWGNSVKCPFPYCKEILRRECMLPQHAIKHTNNYNVIFKCLLCPTLVLLDPEQKKEHLFAKHGRNKINQFSFDPVYIPASVSLALSLRNSSNPDASTVSTNIRQPNEVTSNAKGVPEISASNKKIESLQETVKKTDDKVEYMEIDDDVAIMKSAVETIEIPSEDKDTNVKKLPCTGSVEALDATEKFKALITNIKSEPIDTINSNETTNSIVNNKISNNLQKVVVSEACTKKNMPKLTPTSILAQIARAVKNPNMKKLKILKISKVLPVKNNAVVSIKDSGNRENINKTANSGVCTFGLTKDIKQEKVDVNCNSGKDYVQDVHNTSPNIQSVASQNIPEVKVVVNENDDIATDNLMDHPIIIAEQEKIGCEKKTQENQDSLRESVIENFEDVIQVNLINKVSTVIKTEKDYSEAIGNVENFNVLGSYNSINPNIDIKKSLNNIKKSLDTPKHSNFSNLERIEKLDIGPVFRTDAMQTPVANIEVSITPAEEICIKQEPFPDMDTDFKISDFKKIYHIDVTNIKQEVSEIDTNCDQDWELGDYMNEVQPESDGDYQGDLIIIDPKREVIEDNSGEIGDESDDRQMVMRKRKKTTPKKERKLYRCKRCSFQGVHRSFLEHKRHFCDKNSKRNRADSYYLCSKCSTFFENLNQYIRHFADHGYPKLTCPKCFLPLKSFCSLESHVHSHIRSMFIIYRGINSPQEVHKCGYRCKVCEKIIKKNTFFQHWDSHLELKDWEGFSSKREVCNRGPAIAQFVDLFKSSEIDHDYNRKHFLSCQICKRQFKRRNDCKRHIIEHLLADAYKWKHRTKDLMCQICNETFKKSEGYRSHMRYHASLPMYKCEICDKTFSDSSNFSKHKKVHNFSGTLICDICKKKFNKKKQLIKHIELHQTMKPITCDHCSKIFYSASAFRKHYYVIHDKTRMRYKCQQCSRSYNSLRDKWDHMWLVHRERKSKADCPFCFAKFRKYTDVKRHIAEVHEIKEIHTPT